MRFTTLTFLLFFVAFYFAYWALPARRRVLLMVVGSLIFYSAWSIPFAFHFLGIVVFNYWLISILHERPSRRILWFLLAADLTNLFAFKYFYLFLQTVFDVGTLLFGGGGAAVAGLHPDAFNQFLEQATGLPGIVLPLAISFYTFQVMAYGVDVYRGRIEERASFVDFAAFILFFPQLVAGPIMRHSDFFHQLNANRANEEQTVSGMYLLLLGIIKKVIIADNVLPIISPIFTKPELYDWQSNLAAALGFSARVYCDFSGYTDIARGLGKLLGIDLPENFRAPYLATSFRDTWQRWHVTLSTWIRDYLYIPLGGSRLTEARNFLTVSLSFTLAGLWHGAAYHYVVWGAGHGLLLASERVLRRQRDAWLSRIAASASRPSWYEPVSGFVSSMPVKALRKTLAFLFIFAVWNILAVAFNAPSMTEAWSMWKQVFTGGTGLRSARIDFLGQMLLVTMLLNALQLREKDWQFGGRLFRYAGALLLAAATVLLLGRFSPEGTDFIYFQF